MRLFFIEALPIRGRYKTRVDRRVCLNTFLCKDKTSLALSIEPNHHIRYTLGMELLQALQQNWSVIAQAPFAILSIALVSATASFIVGRFLSKEKIEVLEGRIAQRDDVIAQYRDKLAGASPEEAKDRIAILEKRLEAIEPKNLRQDQNALFSAIVASAPGEIQITHDIAAQDFTQLARQLSSALVNAGWTVLTAQAMGIGSPPRSGILLTSRNGNDPTPEAKLLMRAFDAVGLAVDTSSLPQEEAPTNFRRPKTELLISRPY